MIWILEEGSQTGLSTKIEMEENKAGLISGNKVDHGGEISFLSSKWNLASLGLYYQQSS